MKKLLLIIFYLVPALSNAQVNEVTNAISQAKELISQGKYELAQDRLEDMSVYEVMLDSINYYLKYIEYRIDLDSVESLFLRKRFTEARNMFNNIYPRHTFFIHSTPSWILRCDTIAEAQRQGRAVTQQLAEVIKEYRLSPDGNNNDYLRVYKTDGDYKLYIKGCRLEKNKSSRRNPYYNQYEKTYNVRTDMVAVCRKGKWGYVRDDVNPKLVIDCIYDEVSPFHEGRAYVRKGKKWAYIDTEGKIIIEGKWDVSLWNTTDTEWNYESYDRWHFDWYWWTNRVSYRGFFSEGIIVLRKPDTYDTLVGYDTNGNVLFEVDPVRDWHITVVKIGLCHNGLICLESRDDVLYINKQGEIVIPLAYDSHDGVKAFIDSLAIVAKRRYCKNENHRHFNYGVIDTNNQVIVPLKYSEIDYHNGLFSVADSTKLKALADKNGHFLTKFEYEDFKWLNSEGLIMAKKHGKWGGISNTGALLFDFKYNDVGSMRNDFAIIMENGIWGIVDKFGTTTFDYY